MPNDAIVIIDSSEEEDEPPKKKSKHANIETQQSEFRITNITSLASVENSPRSTFTPDVVIIDDDDEIINTKAISVAKVQKNDIEIMKNKTEQIHFDDEVIIAQMKTVIEDDEDRIKNLNEQNSLETVEQLMEDLKNTIEGSSNVNGENRNESNTKAAEMIPQENTTEFLKFLDLCESCNCEKKFKEVIKRRMAKIKERYTDAVAEYTTSRHFVKLLEKSVERIEKKANDAIVCFNEVYQELGARKDRGVILEDRHILYVAKLNSFLRKIGRKISELENQPVDWDAEENSSYMQLDRYRKRFCDVHKKICAYTKENIHASRMIYNNLNFDASKYIILNRAIDKLYSRTKTFPTYYEVDKCIRQCVKEKNVNLIGTDLDTEIRNIFVALGKLLQRRRKTELQVVLTDYLQTSSDPAKEDQELNSTLEKQFKSGEEKMEALLQKFTDRQLNGEEPAVSSDSGNSHEESDTEENNINDT